MKVKDLIEFLERMDPDAPVVLDHPDYVGSKYFEITRVDSEEGHVASYRDDAQTYWRNPEDCYRRDDEDFTTEEVILLS